MIGVTDETAQLLLNRVWKGNVRELENVIERGVLLSKGPLLEPEDIASDNGELAQVFPSLAPGDHAAAPVSIWEMERDLIMRTLEVSYSPKRGWSMTRIPNPPTGAHEVMRSRSMMRIVSFTSRQTPVSIEWPFASRKRQPAAST